MIFFCTWQFCELYNYAYAFQDIPQRPGEQIRTTAGEFEGDIEDINALLQRLSSKAEADEEIEQEVKNLTKKMKALKKLDKEIRKEFKETEKKLKKAGLPPEILKRHRDMVRHYEQNLQELKDQVKEIKGLKEEVKRFRKGKNKAKEKEKEKEFKAKVLEAEKSLKKKIKKKEHKKLDPGKLPFRTPRPIKREPRLKKEDFKDPNKGPVVDDRKPVQVAALGDLSGLVLAQATNAPTAQDLAETVEVKFTPDIQAKAAELNHDPVKIFNWVRNNCQQEFNLSAFQANKMSGYQASCFRGEGRSSLLPPYGVAGITSFCLTGWPSSPALRFSLSR